MRVVEQMSSGVFYVLIDEQISCVFAIMRARVVNHKTIMLLLYVPLLQAGHDS